MRQYTGIFTSLIALFMAGCATKGESTNNTELKILPVTVLGTKDTILHRSYVTDIQAVQNVEIRARVNGFLDKIYIDEGQEVKKDNYFLVSVTLNTAQNWPKPKPYSVV